MSLKLSKWFFLLLIVSLPLVRPFNLSLFDLQVPCTDLIFIVSFSFWLIAVILRQTSIRTDRLFLFVSLYAFAFTISTIFSVDQTTSFHKLLGEYYLFTLCFLTFNFVQDRVSIKRVAVAWLVGTGLTVIASIAGFGLFYLGFKTQDNNYFLSHFGSLPSGNYPRIHALFANANMLCNYLNVSIMITVVAEKIGWISRKIAILLGIGIVFSALLSISPGLGGIVLSLGLWLWAIFPAGSNKQLARPALALGIFLAFAAFASTLISPDTNNTTQEISVPFVEKKIEPSVRVLVWEQAIETIWQYPWFGKGTGMDVARVKYETLSGGKQILGDAHNMWLNIAGQTGLFGLATFMVLMIFLLKRCRFRLSKDDELQYLLVGLSSAFIGAFVYQSIAGSYEDARHLWVLIGLIIGVSVADFNSSESDISAAS